MLTSLWMTAAPMVTAAATDCISDLSEIFNTQVLHLDVQPRATNNEIDKDDDALRFVLCPNTTFRSTTNGRALLELFGRNVHIMCGENGSSQNNCIFEGVASSIVKDKENSVGGYQMVVSSPPSIATPSTIVPQIYVSGVTFTKLQLLGDHETLGDVSVHIENNAQVSFVDCHWKNNVGDFIFHTSVSPPLDALSELEHVNLENKLNREHHNKKTRSLQGFDRGYRENEKKISSGGIFGISRMTKDIVASQVEVTFDSCSFRDNTLLFGVISNAFGNIVVKNSLFENNDMTRLPVELMTDFTFVIDSFYGQLTLQDNSFVDNRVTLSPVTVEFSKFDVHHNCFSNNDRIDANKGCDTILEVDDGTLLAESVELQANYQCMDKTLGSDTHCPSSNGQFTIGNSSAATSLLWRSLSFRVWCGLSLQLSIALWLL